VCHGGDNEGNNDDRSDQRFVNRFENGYIENFNGPLRNELLSREVFGHLLEARVLGSQYRQEYNTERPHSSLD
jgi:transposase InsO family protein